MDDEKVGKPTYGKAAQDDWQVSEIKAGLAEADQGRFATDADVARVVAKYVTQGRNT